MIKSIDDILDLKPGESDYLYDDGSFKIIISNPLEIKNKSKIYIVKKEKHYEEMITIYLDRGEKDD